MRLPLQIDYRILQCTNLNPTFIHHVIRYLPNKLEATTDKIKCQHSTPLQRTDYHINLNKQEITAFRDFQTPRLGTQPHNVQVCK